MEKTRAEKNVTELKDKNKSLDLELDSLEKSLIRVRSDLVKTEDEKRKVVNEARKETYWVGKGLVSPNRCQATS